jgi:hypothetical protein
MGDPSNDAGRCSDKLAAAKEQHRGACHSDNAILFALLF